MFLLFQAVKLEEDGLSNGDKGNDDDEDDDDTEEVGFLGKGGG